MQYLQVPQHEPFLDRQSTSVRQSTPPTAGGHGLGRVDAFHNRILQAAQRRDVELIREILREAMATMSPQQLDECLALHYAAWMRDVNDIAEQLLNMQCSPYKTDFNGDSVFHYAVKGCNFNFLVKMREREGTRIFNVVNNNQANLMLTAAAETPDDRPYEILRVMEWMYLQGCSIETQDAEGKSPLLWAVHRGSGTVVEWLLSRGANLGHRDHNGNTVLHLGCAAKEDEVVLTLCDKGAINLLGAASNDPTLYSPVKVCVAKRMYFLAMSLQKWSLQHKLFGKTVIFKTMYAWYYWILVLVNLFVNGGMALKMHLGDEEHWAWPISVTWVVLWLLSQICWLIAFKVDPGKVKHDIVPTQFHRCSSEFKVDMNAPPVIPVAPDSAAYELHRVEREMLRWSYAMIKLNRKYRRTDASGKSVMVLPHIEKQFAECGDRIRNLKDQAARLMDRVGPERQAKCPARYVRHVMHAERGEVRKVCLTCRLIKPMRAHHCAACMHCIDRFDHHCIWVDTCIGIGNQRSFFFFLSFLSLSILYSYGYLGFFIYSHLDDPDSTWLDLLKDPLILIGIINMALNFVWLVFVGFLLLRTYRSMFTNITFYETMKKPDHIQRRFNRDVDHCCWTISDLSLGKMCRNIYAYFSLDTRFDSVDYPPAPRGATKLATGVAPPGGHHFGGEGPGVMLQRLGTGYPQSQLRPPSSAATSVAGGGVGGGDRGHRDPPMSTVGGGGAGGMDNFYLSPPPPMTRASSTYGPSTQLHRATTAAAFHKPNTTTGAGTELIPFFSLAEPRETTLSHTPPRRTTHLSSTGAFAHSALKDPGHHGRISRPASSRDRHTDGRLSG